MSWGEKNKREKILKREKKIIQEGGKEEKTSSSTEKKGSCKVQDGLKVGEYSFSK